MKIKSPIIWISVLGFLSLLSLEWNGISKLNDFFMYMPFFSFGMASSLFFRKRKYGLVLMINSFLIFAVLSFVEVDSISMGLNKSNFFSYAFCFVIYLICMIAYRGKCSNILSYVGIISYPLYLLHQDIGLILIKMISAPSAWVGIASAVCIVFVLSVLVNAVVEQYQPKLRERFSIESFRPKRVV